jgi:hypothetical protein
VLVAFGAPIARAIEKQTAKLLSDLWTLYLLRDEQS